MKTWKLNAGTYGFNYFVVLAPVSENKKVNKFVVKEMEDKSYETDLSKYGALTFKDTRDGHCPILWFPKKPTSPTDYSIVAHECLHLVVHILNTWTCLPLDEEHDEAYTYLLQYVMKDVLTKLKS